MRWLSYRQSAGADDRYLKLARKWGVSEVARGANGFMGVYKKAGTASAMKRKPFSASLDWGRRRDNFVRRHLAQYRKSPTPRRALALRMWAYAVDDGGELEAEASRLVTPKKQPASRVVRRIKVPSHTVQGKEYTVSVMRTGGGRTWYKCTCQNWTYQELPPQRRSCKHIDSVRR